MLDETVILNVDTTCGYCKKKGHAAEECRKKMRDAEAKRKTNRKPNRNPKKNEHGGKEKKCTLF
jgi:hypothetical protein